MYRTKKCLPVNWIVAICAHIVAVGYGPSVGAWQEISDSQSATPADARLVSQPTQPPADSTQPTIPRVPATLETEPAPATAEPTESSPTRLTYRRSRFRLASVPNMFGDLFGPGNQVLFNQVAGGNANGLGHLPLAGGLRRMKIGENNKALPMDRVYFNYNYFENAFLAQNDPTQSLPNNGVPTGPRKWEAVDRFVLGVEKTCFDELISVDIRLPMTSDPSFNDPAGGYAVFGDQIGNVNIVLKGLLSGDDQCALTAGLGIDLPTGGDMSGVVQAETFVVRNEAIFLQPFVGCVVAPNDRLFYHGLAELDFALNGNRIDQGGDQAGVLQDQTLLLLDFAAGYWLRRNPSAPIVTGLAGLIELHFTTTLQDTDAVQVGNVFNPANTPPVNFLFRNQANRVDIADLTVGLHTELAGRTTLRVGGVFPLSDRSNRQFDSELAVQLNRYY